MTMRTVLLVALVIMQTACALGGPSKPSKFYVLSAIPGTPVPRPESADAPFSIAVGPVSLPDTVGRPQIITRVDANRIELNEFNRWGGDLGQNVVRVLTQDLMARLNTEDVSGYPWQGAEKPLYQVRVQFFHFEGELGKRARLSGVWQLLDGQHGCQLTVRRFDIEKTPRAADYGGFVQALSEGLARLSQNIAEGIAAARPSCP